MTKKSSAFPRTAAAASTLISLALVAQAADQPAPPVAAPLQKPAWLTDLSVGVKTSYDDNMFLSGVDPKYYSSGYTVPPGSVAALENRWSWVTTVSPKLGVNFAPLLGEQTILQTLSLAYAPDFAIYHDQTSESYDAHRFSAGVKAKTDAFFFGLDEAFVYIDGSKMGPTYPGGFVTAYAANFGRNGQNGIPNAQTRDFGGRRCVPGRIPNTASWSSARPTCWRRICASLPSSELELMSRNGIFHSLPQKPRIPIEFMCKIEIAAPRFASSEAGTIRSSGLGFIWMMALA